MCESYLKVMGVRMGARLAYVRDVPEQLLGHPFPPLMLISLVENAIKHGIEPIPGGGNISLCALVEDRGMTSQLAVSVIDDGVGLKPGLGGGVGLENIRAQLAARFGAYGELAIRARPAGGVTATIRVPHVEGQP
jgi:sensor histidine kinase YesM